MAPQRKPPPFELDRGLRLEDRNVVLPWGASRQQLEPLGAPAVETQPFYAGGDVRLFWAKARVFDGIQADLRAPIGGATQEALREIYFWPAFLQEEKDVDAQHQRTVEELKPRLGKPARSGRTESGLAAGLFYPWTRWSFGGVTLRVKIHENMGAFYIPYFEMRLAWKAPLSSSG
jgi:hypothetical protein